MSDTAQNYNVIAQFENGKRNRVPIKMWNNYGDDQTKIEDAAVEQLLNVGSLPFIHHHVAAMPDTHWGIGATVGSVIATKNAIIPAAVGVDIGCGMLATQVNLTATDLPDNLFGVRNAIEAAVPHGRTDNGGDNDRGAWHDAPTNVVAALTSLTVYFINQLVRDAPHLSHMQKKIARQAGTLGTGNHFIEVCLDTKNNVWIMLHSGSRGIGNAIGTHYIALAKREMERWQINLPDMNLAYLPEGSDYFDKYWKAVAWAQQYASINRGLMLQATLSAMSTALGREVRMVGASAINCHHNYVAKENHFGENVYVTRKGAVRARTTDLGIIPGSMGARSYIVRGKGNPDSFCSCSHGAGRAMSRGEAKRRFSVKQHEEATKGVECRKDSGVIDETPGAYKDIDKVMAAQSDLVEVVETLRQVVCVKG